MIRCQVLLLLVLCAVPLCSQWDANGHVQLKLRSNIDLKDEGNSIYSRKLVVDEQNRIVAVRLGRRLPDTMFSIVVERLLPNGVRDQTYGSDGVSVVPFGPTQHGRILGVFPDESGALVVVANVGPTPFFTRLLSNGSLDTSYGTKGFVWLDPTFTYSDKYGAATGHNVSLSCSKVIDDTTTRCLLVNVSNLGVVGYEPYVSSRCDRFLVYHHGEQFLASGRTIIKLGTNGLFDTTFGGYGSVRWRHLGGDAYCENLALYDDTTLVLLTSEYSPGSAHEASEYAARFYHTQTGIQLDSIIIPFGYFDDPQLGLVKIAIGPNGSIAFGGSMVGDKAATSPIVYKYTNRTTPDTSFYATGSHVIALPGYSILMDMSVLHNSQPVVFVTPSFIALLGNPPTSVPNTKPEQPLTIVPNPVDNHFTIRAQFPSALLRYEIVSLIGEVVQDGLTDSDGGVTVNTSISRGMYFVRVHRSPSAVLGAFVSVK
ncbi:hypothetical protein BH10BAC6_BH10BAC6_06590 [soil metagenome]